MGWAWVAHQGGSFDSGGAASGTNQIAELTAILRAVEAHPGAEPLLIESDSQYAIRCASEWIHNWKRNCWKNSQKKPVANAELIQAIDAAITGREGPVRFRWVRGHVGNHFNERADELAGLAAAEWAAGRGEVRDDLLAAPETAPAVAPGVASASTANAASAATPSASASTPTPRQPRPAQEWNEETLF